MRTASIYFILTATLVCTTYSCSGDRPGLFETEDSAVQMTAVEYNDFIVSRQSEIIEKIMDWIKMDGDNLVKELEEIIELTEGAIDDIKKQEVYPGGAELKMAALDLFSYYKRTLSGPFMDVAKIFEENGDNLDDETLLIVQEKIQKGTADEAKFDNAFMNAQTRYAKANNMEIQENALQDEIDALSN